MAVVLRGEWVRIRSDILVDQIQLEGAILVLTRHDIWLFNGSTNAVYNQTIITAASQRQEMDYD